MYDYHVHSKNSQDGRLSIDEICSQYIELGFKEIAFTDHLDFDCPGKIDLMLDYERYSAEIEEAREKYRGLLNIAKGMEMGLQPQVAKKNALFVNTNQFDFIIGSVHYINGLGLFNGDFCYQKSREEAYTAYLRRVDLMIENSPHFHVMGHLDVIRRFPGYTDRTMRMSEFPDLLDSILTKLVNMGKGIEVNSSGFRFGLDDTLPALDIIKRYRELGGEIITVGSDCHRGNSIGFKIYEAFNVLREAGFTYVCLFREGKHIKVNLP